VRVDLFGLRPVVTSTGACGAAASGRPGARARPALSARNGDSHRQDGAPADSGTADSNELWMDVVLKSGDRIVGRSAGWTPTARRPVVALRQRLHARSRRQPDRPPQPQTSSRRSQQPDTAGAATPCTSRSPCARPEGSDRGRVRAVPQVRRDLRQVLQGDPGAKDALPWSRSRPDRITFRSKASRPRRTIPFQVDPWQRWNDYGIGSSARADAASFARRSSVRRGREAGAGDGALNRARVQLREGRLDDAAASLERAVRAKVPAYPGQ